jgi:hypothetical protein
VQICLCIRISTILEQEFGDFDSVIKHSISKGRIAVISGCIDIHTFFQQVVNHWQLDAIFATLMATLAYSTISSLLGVMPDKLPVVSEAAGDRMPSIDVSMFDSKGRSDPSSKLSEDDEKKNEQKKD